MRAALLVENLTDELYPVQGNASLATLGYAEMIYARGRNAQGSVTYQFCGGGARRSALGQTPCLVRCA